MEIPIFIDGAAGTTGLLIEDHLRKNHPQFAVLSLAEHERKHDDAKRALMAEARCAVLCLPDNAAAESARIAEELGVRVLDASSAHRTASSWVYGLPELDGGAQRLKIRGAQRVANPGCYATGALLLLNPLVRGNLIRKESSIPIFGVSGYSGGGRSMLQRFAGDGAEAFRYGSYSHKREHKHVREITQYSPLTRKPHLIPSVGAFERGMAVIIPLSREAFTSTVDADAVRESFEASYDDEQFVRVCREEPADKHGVLTIDKLVGTNQANLYCFDHGDHDMTLVCHLDNLGKGASFAAIQNLNIMFGLSEEMGIGNRP